jgi:hypothetical protein
MLLVYSTAPTGYIYEDQLSSDERIQGYTTLCFASIDLIRVVLFRSHEYIYIRYHLFRANKDPKIDDYEKEC